MDKAKRLSALFAAALMTVTMFTGMISAEADTSPKTATLKCGTYEAKATLSSSSKNSGSSITKSKTSTKFSIIYAATVGNRCKQNGDHIRYVSAPVKEVTNSTSSGTSVLPIIINSTDYYAKIASAHAVEKGGKQDAISLGISH